MSVSAVKEYLEQVGLGERIKIFEESSATVELAAQTIGCEIKQIAKTMAFLVNEQPIVIVCAGNMKVDNSKYKAEFHEKAKMVPIPMLEEYIGHAMGGVCPFAVRENVIVYLDESLKENEIVYPAAGDEHSVVRLSLDELEQCAKAVGWIDVCKCMAG